MRVLHVIGGADTGGAMTHLLTLLPALRGTGCDAQLLCLGSGGLADAASDLGIPVRIVAMRAAWDPSAMPALRRELASRRWDVVHTHGMRANLPVRVLWPTVGPRRGGRCLFTTVHSDLALDYTDFLRSRLFPWIDRATVGAVDRVLCVSEYLRTRLVDRGHDPSRMGVVRSGVAAPGDRAAPGDDPTGDSARRSRSESSIAEDVWGGDPPAAGTIRLGTIARLVAVKDIDLLLDVIVLVVQEVSNVRVAVVGDGPEYARLVARATALGLERVVTFPGEVRPGTDVAKEFDVYLLTSVLEGLGMSVLEAMVVGVPVVATDCGGVSEVVEDRETGYLVARGDDREALAREIADRVIALARDGTTRAAMGRRALERVRGSFTVSGAADATLAEYRTCLRARSRGQGVGA